MAVVVLIVGTLCGGCLPSAARMREVQDVRDSGVPLPGSCRDAAGPRPEEPMDRWLAIQHDVRLGGCARKSF